MTELEKLLNATKEIVDREKTKRNEDEVRTSIFSRYWGYPQVRLGFILHFLPKC